MRLIVKWSIYLIIGTCLPSCVAGSLTFKKNKIYADADICSPWGSRTQDVEKYKDYNQFSVSLSDIDTVLKIDWTEWNNWYIILIIAPIPTYGLWKEAIPARLNLEIANHRKQKIELDFCKITFYAENELGSGTKKMDGLSPIPNCQAIPPAIIGSAQKRNFSLDYISRDMKFAKQIRIVFRTQPGNDEIEQTIDIDDDWEFCSFPINS